VDPRISTVKFPGDLNAILDWRTAAANADGYVLPINLWHKVGKVIQREFCQHSNWGLAWA
jgi:hypothetical protein